MPFGVVFLPWKGITEAEIRNQFRMMRKLGFRNLKQVMGSPEWPAERLMEIALEEDLIPFCAAKPDGSPLPTRFWTGWGSRAGSRRSRFATTRGCALTRMKFC